jgi:hypothetical protein
MSRFRSLNIKTISPSPDSRIYGGFFDRGQEEDHYYRFSKLHTRKSMAVLAIFHFFSLLQRKKRWILLINYDELLNAFF